MISIAHLESTSRDLDSYQRERVKSDFVKNAQSEVKDIYEVERILAKRSIKIERLRTSKIQYKIK
jgi:hypothetical protein